MARYDLRGTSLSLFSANDGGPIGTRLLYASDGSVGLQNSDGSRTYLDGSGIVWNAASGTFTAGTIATIKHYTAAGIFIDSLTGLSMTAHDVGLAFNTQDGLAEQLLSGNDVIDARYRWAGDRVDDALRGHDGNDVVYGGAGDDHLDGDSGDDKLFGGRGDDHLAGGTGNDLLRGGNGRDVLTGGDGNDRLAGNAGADVFHFDVITRKSGHFTWETGWGHDVIADFQVGRDSLSFEGIDAAAEATIADTADGLLITYHLRGAFGDTTPTTILLAGVHGDYGMDHLIL